LRILINAIQQAQLKQAIPSLENTIFSLLGSHLTCRARGAYGGFTEFLRYGYSSTVLEYRMIAQRIAIEVQRLNYVCSTREFYCPYTLWNIRNLGAMPPYHSAAWIRLLDMGALVLAALQPPVANDEAIGRRAGVFGRRKYLRPGDQSKIGGRG